MHICGRCNITSSRVQHWGRMHCCLVDIVVVQCLCDIFLFPLGFLAWTIVVHTLKAMKFISYAYECTHGDWGVDCKFVMVEGVGRDTSVL